ncbi:MAG: 2-oxo-tetronate isomerase [Burkholderiaceae bacterium]|nr:hydroxypyruvate isomerase [Candidatus Fonsibacter lacus]
MPRFAANVSLLFTEQPFLQRFEAAAQAGFEAVECLFPYSHPATEVAAALRDSGLRMVLHNAPPGQWQQGERGLACLPGREDDFKQSLAQALRYADALEVPRVHVMAGLVPAGVPHATWHATWLANLRHAAHELAAAGRQMLLEPLNAHDVPGYALGSVGQAEQLLDTLQAPNAALQFDIYHAQRTQGELASTLTRVLPRVGHMQLADVPGRHQPGTGEIAYPFLFEHIDRLGYNGWIGCEYHPTGSTQESLGWLPRTA